MNLRKLGMGVLVLVISMFVIAGAGKPWFDMDNCGFCKNLTAEEGLMEHITKWEHHNVKNGAVSITEVDAEWMPKYMNAMKKMEETGMKMQQGEKVSMCGMCEAYGALHMKGCQWDVVESGNTVISLMWSDNEEVVAEIHALTDRTNKEMAMMEEAKKHESHDH